MSEYGSRRRISADSRQNRSRKRRRRSRRRKQQNRYVSFAALICLCVVLFVMCYLMFRPKKADVLEGVWSLDDSSSYEFDGCGKGSMNISGTSYSFDYDVEDDWLKIDFASESITDSAYYFQVEESVLIISGDEGTIGGIYQLTKIK